MDGEGWIGLRRRKRPGLVDEVAWVEIVQVSMTHPDVPVELRRIFGGHIWAQGCTKAKRRMFCWRVSNKQAGQCVIAVFPYLVVKKEQARLLLEYRALRRPFGRQPKLSEVEMRQRREVADQMKKLNQRGKLGTKWTHPSFGG